MTVEKFLELMSGYQLSQCVFVAMQLRVFDALAQPRTATEVFGQLEINADRGEDLLDILASAGVLTRRDGRYQTAPEITAVLDSNLPGLPGTLRSLVTHHATLRYTRWGQLLETVRVGKHPPYGGDGFSGFHESPEELEAYTRAMFEKTTVWGAALADGLDLSGYKTFLDMGGAAGAMTIAVSRRWTHLAGITADLPRLEPLAERRITEAGLSGRVRFAPCDFLKDEFPKADLICFSSVFHNWDVATRRVLAEKSARALPSGGALLVCENFLNDARDNTEQLLGSFNMAVMHDEGSEFSVQQLGALLAPSGFSHTDTRRLVRHAQVAVFRKG